MSLKAIWDEHVGDNLKIDKKWVEKVIQWKRAYMSKNQDHVDFFTGHYFGYVLPRWMKDEDNYWLIDILEIDEDVISEAIYKLPEINRDWSVSSNILSMGFLYLLHRLERSGVPDKEKKEGQIALLECLLSRYISLLMVKYFGKFTPSLPLAQETYDRLSRRFDLKECGSWAAFIRYRAEGYLGEGARRDAVWDRKKFLMDFDAKEVVLSLNAIKTRLNKAFIELYAVYKSVVDEKESLDRIGKATSEGADGSYVADLTRRAGDILRYQDQIFYDPRSWIKMGLMDAVINSIPQLAVKRFTESLIWLTEQGHKSKLKKEIDKMRHEITLYGWELIVEEQIPAHDLVTIASRLRQNFMSGKTSDGRLVRSRKTVDKVISLAVPGIKTSTVSLERTGILIYIVLRTLAMDHYK